MATSDMDSPLFSHSRQTVALQCTGRRQVPFQSSGTVQCSVFSCWRAPVVDSHAPGRNDRGSEGHAGEGSKGEYNKKNANEHRGALDLKPLTAVKRATAAFFEACFPRSVPLTWPSRGLRFFLARSACFDAKSHSWTGSTSLHITSRAFGEG